MAIRERGTPKDLFSGLTAEKVRELFSYDQDEGILRWRKKICRNIEIGQPAGTAIFVKGRVRCFRVVIKGVVYEAHRLIWLYMTGKWPVYLLEHKDRDGSNNKWDNLCETNRNWSARHSAVREDSNSGLVGIHEARNGFKVMIRKYSRLYHVGTYTTIEEARAARRAAMIILNSKGFVPDEVRETQASPKVASALLNWV